MPSKDGSEDGAGAGAERGVLAAAYFLSALNEVIQSSFGFLKRYEDWTDLLVWLLGLVRENNVATRAWEERKETTIVPPPCDIVGVCRLLLHSLVSLRLLFPDGQRREQALLSAFTSHYVQASSRRNPARYFQRDKEVFADLFEPDRSKAAETFTKLCSGKLWSPANVFICFPRSENQWTKNLLLSSSVTVSKIREKASKNKSPCGNSNV